MQINNFLVNTPKIQYSVPNFCATNPIKEQDNHINSDFLNNGIDTISRAEIEIQKKLKEQQDIDKLLNSMTKIAKEKKVSKNYLAEIVNACKNEDDTLNKDALHLANHFMKSGMSMSKKDNILGTIEFCKDKNGFSKKMGATIENYIDNRMKPQYKYCANKFSEHLTGGRYFNSNNPIKNEEGVFDKDCLDFLYRYSKIKIFDDITNAAYTLCFVNPFVDADDENNHSREIKKLIMKSDKFLYCNEESISNILNVARSCNIPEANLIPSVIKKVIKDDDWTPNMIDTLCTNCCRKNEKGETTVFFELFQRYDALLKDKMILAGPINNFVAYFDTFTPENINEWYKNEDCQNIIKDVEDVKQHMIKNSSLYVNDIEDVEFSQKLNELIIKDFFGQGYNYQTLIHFVGMFDKKTLDVLMRKRLDDVQEFINIYATIPDNDRMIVARLAECKNIDGKDFTPHDKIHFIDLVNAYRQNRISTKNIETYIDYDNDTFDINAANLLLINKVLYKCGLTKEEIDSIPKEKIDSIDIKNIHLFIESLKADKSGTGKDLLKVMMTKDFDSYIQDKTNKYGYSNFLTKQEFDSLGLNYQNWINADKELEVRLQSGRVNGQSIDNIADQLYEDIDAIRKSPIGGFFDKQFKKYITDNEFIIPKEISTNEKNLGKFVEEILTRLEPAKIRAQRNLELNSTSETAQNTLTYINHLEQRLKDIEALNKIPTDRKLDVTVKMWDRNPVKDIYQGNYSTCCLAMGNNTNGEAIFNYLLNTSFNMIEIVDNKSNKTIGNALCYFTKDENNNPAFIIDNIEISNKHKLSDESSLLLRDKIKEYAQNIVSSVSDKDIPIYLGTNYNDVSTDDLNTISKQMKFVGDITNSHTYLDLYNGWNNKNKLDKTVNLFKL